MMLAAAELAIRLDPIASREPQISRDRVPGSPLEAPALADARPIAALLRNDARQAALGGPDAALVDAIGAQLADMAPGAAGLAGARMTLPPRSRLRFPAPRPVSIVVAADGRSPLVFRRAEIVDPDATATLALLLEPPPGTEDIVHIENLGAYPTDLLCAWAEL
jgi:hypothetical protein